MVGRFARLRLNHLNQNLNQLEVPYCLLLFRILFEFLDIRPLLFAYYIYEIKEDFASVIKRTSSTFSNAVQNPLILHIFMPLKWKHRHQNYSGLFFVCFKFSGQNIVREAETSKFTTGILILKASSFIYSVIVYSQS